MDLESNDFISTTALNHAVEKAGFETKFGKYYLTVEDLVQLGLKPAAKLRNGTYWHKEAVQQLINQLTNGTAPKKNNAVNSDKVKKLETDVEFLRTVIHDIHTLAGLMLDDDLDSEFLHRLLTGYTVFGLEWSKQK